MPPKQPAQQIALARGIERDQPIESVAAAPRRDFREGFGVARGEPVEQGLRFGQASRDAGHRLGGARPARSQHGEHVAAQVIACVAGVGIGFVVDPAQAVRLCMGFERAARHAEQRPQRGDAIAIGGAPCGHAGETQQSGAAHHVVQQRFRLIVGVVGGQQRIEAAVTRMRVQRRIARVASGTFESVGRDTRHLDMQHAERQIEHLALRGAEIRPEIGVRTETVVDMGTFEPPAVLRTQQRQAVQQYG